ncbi:MAG: metallophosphoesterase [Planctomycetota bacterium]
MKILVTADLHYNIGRSRQPAEQLARRVAGEGGDALVLVGDTAGADLRAMREALQLFADFPGRRLLVPGNHCLWCQPGQDSLERYERVLPELAAEEGFSLLDHEPVVLGGVGLVGSVGWYDYSFRDPALGIPLEFYRAKLSPGAARYYGRRDLIDRHADAVTDEQMRIGARWMDVEHIRLPMSDEAFAEHLTRRLTAQLKEMTLRTRQIAVFLHHLPFEELLPHNRPAKFRFAGAFLGARRMGEALRRFAAVSHVYCGHSHWRARKRVGHMHAINVGSTYTDKHLDILQIDREEYER